MRIGVPTETAPGERRVALVPEIVRKLAAAGHEVVLEPGAGAGAGLPDALFEEAGATTGDPWQADAVVKVAPPSAEEAAKLGELVLIGFLAPLTNQEGVERIAASGATAFAMEKIPRISRAQSMDALSSQATVSGYLAVLTAAEELPRFFPMLMTAAGTIKPAQVLVLGRRRGRPAGDRHRPPPRRRRDRLRRPRRRQGAGPVAGREVLRGRGHRPTRRPRPATPAS